MSGHLARRPWRAILAFVPVMLTGCAATEGTLDFRTFQRPATPNTYLVCDPELCTEPADRPSPRFAASPDAVLAAVRRIASDQPRTALVREDPARNQLVFVQRSAVFRFPDTIWVQTVALPEGQTLLAVYSAAAYGYDDFGVNRDRVESWLAAVDRQLGAPGGTGR